MHLLEWNKLIYNYNMEFSFWDKQKRSGQGWRMKCVEKCDFSMDTVIYQRAYGEIRKGGSGRSSGSDFGIMKPRDLNTIIFSIPEPVSQLRQGGKASPLYRKVLL